MDSRDWAKLQRCAREIRLLQDQIQAADAAGHFALAKTLSSELALVEQQRETLVDHIYSAVAQEPSPPRLKAG